MITIPTLSQLYQSIITDLNTEFGLTINPVGKAVLRAVAAVMAGKMKLYYLKISLLQKNMAPDTCDQETLLRYGLIKLGRLPFPAIAGQYKLQVTGQIGAVIPAQTTFKSDDESYSPGIIYQLDNDYVLLATTDYITVRSLTLGTASKLEVGDTLTPTAPIALVNSDPGSAIVDSEVVQPLAAEDIEEDYRPAVIQSYRLEPQGGAGTDYRIWAQDAQGVKEVYPYATPNAPSQINLYIEANKADSIDGKGTPSAQIIQETEDVVNFSPDTSLTFKERGRRPVQVIVNYIPVTPREIVVTITGGQNIDAPLKVLLSSALDTAISAIRPFAPSAFSVLDQNDYIDNNKLIGILTNAKPGIVFTGVSFTIDGIPYSSYTFTNGDITYFNPTVIYN
jgi:hypothetical protein